MNIGRGSKLRHLNGAFLMGAALVVAMGLAMGMLAQQAYADTDSARASIRDTSGSSVGTAKLIQKEGRVQVRVSVYSLPPGFHGFHIHATGVCEAPFTSAGGHFNPLNASHRDHAGDLPVLLINADGHGEARFSTDRFTLAEILDADGSALIVHALPDNYANIPTRYAASPDATTLATGDAGGRIACGVIEADD